MPLTAFGFARLANFETEPAYCSADKAFLSLMENLQENEKSAVLEQ